MISEHQTGFSANPPVWSYGMAMPWNVPQHSGHQLAFPIPVHFVAPQLNSQWFPVENFASLPPKPKKEKDLISVFENSKPTRRFSDPGPNVRDIHIDKTTLPTSKRSKPFAMDGNEWNQHSENQHFDGILFT